VGKPAFPAEGIVLVVGLHAGKHGGAEPPYRATKLIAHPNSFEGFFTLIPIKEGVGTFYFKIVNSGIFQDYFF